MASARNTIKDQIIAVLNGISVESGYGSTVAGVSRSFQSIEQVAAFPHLAVIDGDQSMRPGTEEGSMWEGEVSFGIVGCVKAGEGASLSETCDMMIEDIRAALQTHLSAILADVDAGALRLITDEILPDETGGAGYIAVFVTFGFVTGSS